MNIPKAIEILHLITDTPPSGASPDFIDAIKLGIEALKQKKESRKSFPKVPIRLLPGETED